jgi:phosphate transport system permease protein
MADAMARDVAYGLATAVILGTARGIGETSPVLLTAGATTFVNHNPLNGPQVSLPLQTYLMTRSPYPSYLARGFGAAAVLMFLVLVLFVVARAIGGRGPGNLSRRQAARVAAASKRDLTRFDRVVEPAKAVPESQATENAIGKATPDEI